MLPAVRLDRFQSLAVTTTIATYLLIGVGGLVRAAGAGLGCPDWPKCFDRWIPPVDAAGVPPHIDPALFNFAKAWTEYLNRLLGVAVGVLILATMVVAVRRYRGSPWVLWPTVAAFLLVLFQGWLGGQVVSSGLEPLVLTAHLTFALVIVSLLLVATVFAFFPPHHRPPPLSGPRRMVAWGTVALLVLLLVQTGLGALVRGEVQLLSEAGSPRAEWAAALRGVHVVHRSFAILLAAAAVLLSVGVRAVATGDRWLVTSSRSVLALIAVQVAAGVGLMEAGFPRALQVVHLWAGALILGAVTVQALLLFRLDPRVSTGRSTPNGLHSGPHPV
jgi:cytochrome c oxidase assembly protein subunit 15